MELVTEVSSKTNSVFQEITGAIDQTDWNFFFFSYTKPHPAKPLHFSSCQHGFPLAPLENQTPNLMIVGHFDRLSLSCQQGKERYFEEKIWQNDQFHPEEE